MKDFIRELKYWWNCKTSGLEELADDIRDLHIIDLFASYSYKPKATEKKLFPTYQKNQRGRENCSFQAWSNALAIYFGEEVSARWLTAKAYQEGLCGENGRANLRSGAKVAQKWGVVFEKDCPSDESLSWKDYLNIDYKNLGAIAEKNKIKSYWRVDKVSEYLEAIDRGYGVALGRTWYSGMNTSQLTSPWIIKRIGFNLGGHATLGCGYKGQNTLELNSYGERYGDNGFFGCPFEDLQKDIDQYGAFAVVPVAYSPKDIKVKTIQETLKDLNAQLKEMLKKKV